MIIFQDSPGIEYKLAKKIYYSIFVFSFVWVVLIFTAPVFLEWGGIFANVSSFIYFFFSKVCHQIDDRSFHLLEHKLGVCSRCASIYVGFLLATAIYPLKYKLNNVNIPSVWLLITASFVVILDVSFDEIGLLENTFLSRSITGFILGFVLPFYIIPGFVKFFYEVHSFLRNKFST